MSTVTTLFITPTAARKLSEELSQMDDRVVAVMIQQSPTAPHNMLITLDAGWGKKSFWVDQDGSVVPAGGLATPQVTDRDELQERANELNDESMRIAQIEEDDELVYAFQPRQIDPPQHVCDHHEELEELVGSFISGEQCDGCGNSSYRVERRYSKHGLPSQFSAVCAVDPDDDDEFKHSAPCGKGYPIFRKETREVAF